MASPEVPRRGDVWLVALGAGRPGEPGKTRPAIVISVDALTTGGPGELFVVVPLSSSLAPSALRIEIDADAGIDRPSRAIPRAVRAVVSSRLVRRVGHVTDADIEGIESALALILGIESRSQVVRENAEVVRRTQDTVGGRADRETILAALHEGRSE